MTDLIFGAVLVAILAAAAHYVYKAKKSGAKCIGCAVGEDACHCHEGASHSGCGCGCCGESK